MRPVRNTPPRNLRSTRSQEGEAGADLTRVSFPRSRPSLSFRIRGPAFFRRLCNLAIQRRATARPTLDEVGERLSQFGGLLPPRFVQFIQNLEAFAKVMLPHLEVEQFGMDCFAVHTDVFEISHEIYPEIMSRYYIRSGGGALFMCAQPRHRRS